MIIDNLLWLPLNFYTETKCSKSCEVGKSLPPMKPQHFTHFLTKNTNLTSQFLKYIYRYIIYDTSWKSTMNNINTLFFSIAAKRRIVLKLLKFNTPWMKFIKMQYHIYPIGQKNNKAFWLVDKMILRVQTSTTTTRKIIEKNYDFYQPWQRFRFLRQCFEFSSWIRCPKTFRLAVPMLAWFWGIFLPFVSFLQHF